MTQWPIPVRIDLFSTVLKTFQKPLYIEKLSCLSIHHLKIQQRTSLFYLKFVYNISQSCTQLAQFLWYAMDGNFQFGKKKQKIRNAEVRQKQQTCHDHKEKHSHFEVPKIKKYSKMALLFTATKRIALARYFSIYYIEN